MTPTEAPLRLVLELHRHLLLEIPVAQGRTLTFFKPTAGSEFITLAWNEFTDGPAPKHLIQHYGAFPYAFTNLSTRAAAQLIDEYGGFASPNG